MAKRNYVAVTIGLGSNMGDRKKNLQEAITQMSNYVGTVIKQSSVYESEAWGKKDQDPFLNQVIVMNTSLKPHELLQRLQRIEQQMGRVRKEKYGPRPIDLDILLYGMRRIKDEKLTVPHPEIANRMFVLVPLMEVSPEFKHPITKKRLDDMFLNCPDTGEVVML